LLETLEDDNLDVAIELGIKLFELIAEFKVRIDPKINYFR
jgi:hypothetical protein